MTPEAWQKLKAVLNAAMERPSGERSVFVRAACDGDAEMHRQVNSLISACEDTWSFFERPVSPEAPEREFVVTIEPGRRIGPYEVIREIGHGGMGTVYLAERADEEFRQQVAIKLIRWGLEEMVVRRFRTERQVLANLQHPKIARLLDGGTTTEGLPYIVMEFVDGLPLLEYCDVRRLDVRDRLALFCQVCEAVHYAHQNLVVHRDLKPSNVLVTPEGVPKLLDFGIAKLLNPDPSSPDRDMTASALRPMTPVYASPEQVRGESVTTATDTYSLGVVLYELLTGQLPYRFPTRQPQELARVISGVEPEKPSAVTGRMREATAPGDGGTRGTMPEAASRGRPGGAHEWRRRLRGDLDNIILKALRKEPTRRYASVEQFSEDIRRHLEGHPVIARPDTLRYRAGKFIMRHRAGVAAAALLLLAVLGGWLATARQARVAEAERSKAERRFEDVRKLANTLLFDLHDAIRNLPGSTKGRELLLSKALEHLDNLSAESRGNPALERELATAYMRVGDLRGGGVSSNLGDSGGAAKSYRKALEIRRSLAADRPDDLDLQLELAESHNSVGNAERVAGNPEAALRHYRTAVQIAELCLAARPRHRKAHDILAVSHHGTALVWISREDYRMALEPRRKQVQIYEDLLKADPKDLDAQRNLAVAYKYQGGLLERLEERSHARELFRKAIAIDSERLAANPTNTVTRLDLSYSYGGMGSVLRAEGALADGLEYYRRALDLRQEVARADPRDATASAAVARAYDSIGKILEEMGKWPGALENYRKALAFHEGLLKVNPTSSVLPDLVAGWHSKIASACVAIASDVKAPRARRIAWWQQARSSFGAGLRIWIDLQRQGKLPASRSAEPENVRREIARCDARLAELAS